MESGSGGSEESFCFERATLARFIRRVRIILGAVSDSFSSAWSSPAALRMNIWSINVDNRSPRMTFEGFKKSLSAANPPDALTQALKGLWWDAKGDWTRAHECAQVDESQAGAWVHAYLHRKEGDRDNAAYWYRRAGKPIADGELQQEWLNVAKQLLSRGLEGH